MFVVVLSMYVSMSVWMCAICTRREFSYRRLLFYWNDPIIKHMTNSKKIRAKCHSCYFRRCIVCFDTSQLPGPKCYGIWAPFALAQSSVFRIRFLTIRWLYLLFTSLFHLRAHRMSYQFSQVYTVVISIHTYRYHEY